MNQTRKQIGWFVGAMWDKDDQTTRFIEEGLWENGYQDKYLDDVNSISVGDPIAIKSAYTRKHNLPFEGRGYTASVMAIKAVGIVTENPGDGRRIKVDWKPLKDQREWYFYTGRSTIWKVTPDDWYAEALLAFAFENQPQDINRFINAPYWKERFGDKRTHKERFSWINFYEAFASKLLEYRHNRSELVEQIHKISDKIQINILNDEFPDGTWAPLKDICPFTVMALFNRGVSLDNRIGIASELASFLDILEPVPTSFDAVPIVHNQKSWFFGRSSMRKEDDIDALWEIFAQAIALADSSESDIRQGFISAYNDATTRYGVGWNLTMGLFWIRPWFFPTLDTPSRNYIESKLKINIGKNGPHNRCNSKDYLDVLDSLQILFQDDFYPVHSFPELSWKAWQAIDTSTSSKSDLLNDIPEEVDIEALGSEISKPPLDTYTLQDILNEGCFLSEEKLEVILAWLRRKKNVIFQGPPGTGKTWLAKKLAFALIGQRDESKVRSVQFHPNLSYEDFIRGWRPSGDGKLELLDGPFMEVIEAATKQPTKKFVIVIEEINRGNPAQIFGEMLTLLEFDKRTPDHALELSYRKKPEEKVFIPSNLFVIGTMNIADRSLALVDLALRRRFAFIDLEPTFGSPWRDWLHSKYSIDVNVINEIEHKVKALNKEISDDSSLGPQFRVGHSYLTPTSEEPIDDPKEWFRHIVESEIAPLLDEYWYDSDVKSKQAKKVLLEGF